VLEDSKFLEDYMNGELGCITYYIQSLRLFLRWIDEIALTKISFAGRAIVVWIEIQSLRCDGVLSTYEDLRDDVVATIAPVSERCTYCIRD
jgi:hypothetical protein